MENKKEEKVETEEETYYEQMWNKSMEVDNPKKFLNNLDFSKKMEKASDAEMIGELMKRRDLFNCGILKTRKELEQKEIDKYFEGINWVNDKYCTSWKKTKIKNYSQLKKADKLFFLAHSMDKIEGKPQLTNGTKVRIPLITKTEKHIKKKDEEQVKILYKFIDDKIDKRTDGFEVDVLDDCFWSYRTVYHGEEYILFSKEELGIEHSKFEGMEIKINGLSELSNTLKIRGISKVFFVNKTYPSVETLEKEDLVKFTKEVCEKINLDREKFLDFLFVHPDGKIYRHSKDYEILRLAQLLSGKYEGYPLHIMNMGPPGKGKTCELECLDQKFREEVSILEAGNCTTKALIPSFKEKPANPGYILRCRRVALIDELFKMVHKIMEYGRSDQRSQNHLQELNAILEHKIRGMGSGNDNFFITNPTAKVIFATNPLPGKRTIYQHAGIIDESMLSRVAIWIQDKEERDFIDKNIPKKTELFGINTGNTQQHTYINHINHILYSICVPSKEEREGIDIDKDIFSTIYDSCQAFTCNIDESLLREMVNSALLFVKDPLKSIFQKRLFHHAYLILDGITKFRCLIEDFDPSFKPNEKDIDYFQRILLHMIKTWDVDMSLKDEEFVGKQTLN